MAWNAVSVTLLGLCGIAMSTIVARFHGPAGLGLFNQALAIYVVSSQLAVFGLQLSVLHHGAFRSSGHPEARGMLPSAFFLSLATGTAFGAMLFLARGLLGAAFGSEGLVLSTIWISMALPLFAANKVLLAWVNAQRHMALYAFVTALRYIAMLGALVILIVIDTEVGSLPIAFPVSEALVLLILLLYRPMERELLHGWRDACRWIRKHARFGVRAFPGAALVEANPRIDVLMLGVFADDRAVGIYSLASMFALGAMQLLSVLRVNVNPILSQYIEDERKDRLEEIIRQGKRLTYVAFFLIALASCAVFPVLVRVLVGSRDFAASWPVFAVLMTGISITAGYAPFLMLLTQAGRPELHTSMLGIMVLANVAFNAVLIPFLGPLGAATATGLAQVVGVAVLTRLAWRSLGLHV